MKFFLKLILIFLPWKIKRFFLVNFLKYDIHRNARIGYAWVFPDFLSMRKGSVIKAATIVKGVSHLHMGVNSRIGRGNWITGFPKNDKSSFSREIERDPSLILGDESSITNRHIIDCTSRIEIGDFSTLAGFRSQIITHSIDVVSGIQQSRPVKIGNYSFIGTASIILGGSVIPNYSVFGAGAVINSVYDEEYSLYGGVPAKKIKSLGENCVYFIRERGNVL